MKRLTDPEYWDRAYSNYLVKGSPTRQEIQASHGLVRSLYNRCFAVGNYADSLFWNVICPRYLPKAPAKILEVGCAPGRKLIKFAKTFGYEPYGIDFSEPGVEVTRNLFITNGYNPENVTCVDFLNEDFSEIHKGLFDIVVSMGFIEHFTQPNILIKRHVHLLRDGGALLVSIPNLRGINFGLTYLINREALKFHNLGIMDFEVFQSLFQHPELDTLFCGYYGTFYCGICIDSEKTNSCFAKICLRLQQIADYFLIRFLLKARLENAVVSPYLLYIGRKKGTAC